MAGISLLMIGVSWSLTRDAEPSEVGTPPSRAHAERGFDVEEGGRLYGHYCQPCHGDTGRGDGRFYASSLQPVPTDFTAPAFRASYTDRQLSDAIIGGSRQLGKSDLCPPWGQTFSTTDVEYLVAYIRQLQAPELRLESTTAR